MSFSGGFLSDSSGVGQAINGAVFIIDVTPTNVGNVGGKVFSSNGKVLDQCVTDTDFVTVHILAQTGHTHYVPTVLVNGDPVTLVEDEDKTVWVGSLAIDRAGSNSVVAVHEDGSTHSLSIQSDIGPTVLSAEFTGGYPGIQTELKEGDNFALAVSTDTDMVEMQLDDFGASVGEVFPVLSNTNTIVLVTIANRGTTTSSFGVRLRAKNANGSFGPWFETTTQGNVDGQHQVKLNNLHPSAAISWVAYPGGQEALKDSETAQLDLMAFDFDVVQFTSPNGELNVSKPSLFESPKAVSRVGGNYNVSSTNFRMHLTRNANGATTIVNEIVRIANVAATIQMQTPASRLRSGGTHTSDAQSYNIDITSDQLLIHSPSISVPAASLVSPVIGALPGTAFYQSLQVDDSDPKGTFQFTLIQAQNLAGRVTTTINSGEDFTLGGFVPRTFEVAAFAVEEVIGADVSDLSKVVASDTDNRAMTYHNQFGNQLLGYTITGPTGQLNPSGNLFYWLDNQAVNNNSTGRAKITIEETI